MKSNTIAAVLGTLSAGSANFGFPSLRHSRGMPSAAQQRRADKWAAGAPERAQIAADIKAWNAGVKRRNQRFVARQAARGRV